MFNFLYKTLTSTLLITSCAIAGGLPLIETITPASAQEVSPDRETQKNFADVTPQYWAQPYIEALAAKNIISGFPDGTFRPEEPVDRAEFAAAIANAFETTATRQNPTGFSDVPRNYWAASAIQKAYEAGFMQGYPNNQFQPNQEISKVQAIVALSNGLGLTANNASRETLNQYYSDAYALPDYAIAPLTAATESNLVVNYPSVQQLNPDAPITRAEAAALIHQALVRSGQLQPIARNEVAASYIVGNAPTSRQTPSASSALAANDDIVSVASNNQFFSTFTKAVEEAGLAEELRSQGAYTVFAPTNAAFAALPEGTLKRLMQPENREILAQILRYHVVANAVPASEVQPGEVKTIEGNNVTVNVSDRQIAVNDASVIEPDINASNGVIHAVDRVLIPPDVDLAQLEGAPTAQETDEDEGGGLGINPQLNYIGIGGNIGLGGDSAIGEGSFVVFSKIGLTENISLRPAGALDDDPTVLLPVTYDFSSRSVDPVKEIEPFSVSPYVGGGLGIETSDDADVGVLLTGGVDVPINDQFTATAAANVLFLDDTDVGLMLGIGYRF
jgi:uncharacterized surface protein with fasciclin (FAS1) repeats